MEEDCIGGQWWEVLGQWWEVKRRKVRKGKIQPQGGKWSIISNVTEKSKRVSTKKKL